MFSQVFGRSQLLESDWLIVPSPQVQHFPVWTRFAQLQSMLDHFTATQIAVLHFLYCSHEETRVYIACERRASR